MRTKIVYKYNKKSGRENQIKTWYFKSLKKTPMWCRNSIGEVISISYRFNVKDDWIELKRNSYNKADGYFELLEEIELSWKE